MAAFTLGVMNGEQRVRAQWEPQTESGSKRPRSHMKMLFALCAASALAGCQHTELLMPRLLGRQSAIGPGA
jgi:hypothetical protein